MVLLLQKLLSSDSQCTVCSFLCHQDPNYSISHTILHRNRLINKNRAKKEIQLTASIGRGQSMALYQYFILPTYK
jgi:hypothetical protein